MSAATCAAVIAAAQSAHYYGLDVSRPIHYGKCLYCGRPADVGQKVAQCISCGAALPLVNENQHEPSKTRPKRSGLYGPQSEANRAIEYQRDSEELHRTVPSWPPYVDTSIGNYGSDSCGSASDNHIGTHQETGGCTPPPPATE